MYSVVRQRLRHQPTVCACILSLSILFPSACYVCHMINATCISRGHGFTKPSRKEVDAIKLKPHWLSKTFIVPARA